MADDDFRVELEAFAGPLDLLLYLIQKEEVDVHDIPVARILERYLQVLRAAPVEDLDRAGDFLVMASTLMAVKSAMLLPGGDAEVADLLDPREELVRQIIEYRRFKDTAGVLSRLREEASLRWPRGPGPLPGPAPGEAPDPPGVREATLFDLFACFHRLLRETAADQPRHIVYDEVPQEAHMERVLAAVGRSAGRAGLEALLGARRDREFVLGTFLAVLELMKEGRILAMHRDAEAPIEVVLRDSPGGREAIEAIRSRARRSEEEAPLPPPPPGAARAEPPSTSSPGATADGAAP